MSVKVDYTGLARGLQDVADVSSKLLGISMPGSTAPKPVKPEKPASLIKV